VTQKIDYGNSRIRAVLNWVLYPLGVLLPMAYVVSISSPDQLEKLLPYALLGLLTASVAERIQPHVRKWQQSHGDIVTDIAHVTLSLALSTMLRAGLVYVFFLIIRLPKESYALVSWPTHWLLGYQVILGLVVAEFGTYWRHRLFHEWHLGWTFHSVHHSPRRLYFLNATRFHFVDLCLSGLAGAIPLALCGATPEIAVLVAVLTGLHGNWQHANVRYQLGWLNWIFSAAELHRWHHSSIIRHSNSNYGNNLIVWDALFGTRCLPEEPQDIDQFGLGEYADAFPQTWWRQLFVPFRWNTMLTNAEAVKYQQNNCEPAE
jgi:ornithine lipid hydroxylase